MPISTHTKCTSGVPSIGRCNLILRMPDLGHDEMFLVLMQVHVFAVLSELDGMPTVRFLNRGKPTAGMVCCLAARKRLRDVLRRSASI